MEFAIEQTEDVQKGRPENAIVSNLDTELVDKGGLPGLIGPNRKTSNKR